MGQSISYFKKSKSKSKSRSNPLASVRPEAHNGSKFPIPLESQMLRKIKAQYLKRLEGANGSIDTLPSNCLVDEPVSETYDRRQEVIMNHLAIHKERDSKRSLLGNFPEPDKNTGSSCQLESLGESEALSEFPITELPILVVDKLLDYLNPPAILALRATCTATKGWIDCKRYLLRDLELKIEPVHDTSSYICPPTHTQWSNFSIPYMKLQSAFIEDTISNYSDIIWRLEIYAPKSLGTNIALAYPSVNTNSLFGLINQCSQLEHLGVCRLDTLTNLGDKGHYEKLRVLAIDRLQWMNNSDFAMFESLIMKCPHLEYLKIPEYEILGSLAFNFYDVNVSPEKEHLIQPLIRYLDYCRNSKSGTGFLSRSKKLYIDVLEFEDFKLCSSEIFYELSRKCVECKAVLMNVYFVPRDAVIRNQQDIVESFASMFGFIKIDFHAELWKNLEVMECWIEDFPNDVDLIMRQLSFLKTISKIETLRSLTIRLSIDDPGICSQTLAACVGENYKGVQKLILRRHQASVETHVVIPVGFGNAFSNLKYLYFQELDSNSEDFNGLWGNMPNLEELFMYKCPYLTQDAFLLPSGDDDKPSVLQLKKLQVLVMFLYDGVGGFTDDFLLNALRHMRLRGFAIRGSAGVEFTDKGMLSLLDSPFHETIEDFEAPSISFRPSLCSSYWTFYVALPKKELRRNRIWLSCSVLLNSLSSRKHPYDFKRKCLGI